MSAESYHHYIDTGKFKRDVPSGYEPVILVTCGSFSPITYLHLRMFEMARDELLLNQSHRKWYPVGGIISPVSDAYNKPHLAPAKHRIEICKLASEESDWIITDDWEASQDDHLPTAQVLKTIQERLNINYGECRVVFLAGADLIGTFVVPDLWLPQDIDYIFTCHSVVAIGRWRCNLAELILTNSILFKHRQNLIIVKQHIMNDISSTKIRLFIQRGMSIKYLLPNACVKYIMDHDLYAEE